MKHIYSIISLFIPLSYFLISPVYALNTKDKIEIILKDLKSHKIIPIKDGVLVTYIKNTKPIKGMTEIFVDKYDQDLVKQKKTTKFQIKKGYDFVNYTKDSDFIYFLYAKKRGGPYALAFRYGSSVDQLAVSPSFFKEYTIVKFNPNTAEVQTYSGKYDRKFGASTFQVKHGIVYLGGTAGRTFWGNAKFYIILAPIWWVPVIFYKQSYKPCILSINMNEAYPSTKDLYMKEYGKGFTRISSLDINEPENEFNMFITSIRKRKTALSYNTIKDDVIGKEEKIKFPKEKVLTYVKSKTVGKTKLYAGVYRSKEGITKGERNDGKISEGLAIGMSSNSKTVFNALIPYNKFQNISFVFNAHHDQKKEVKRKVDADIVMSVLFHDILVKDDRVIYMGEMYYRHTHIEMVTEMVTESDGRGGIRSYPAPVFDGYKRKGILVFAVDLKGKLLWDNAIEIVDGTNSEELIPKIVFREQEDSSIYAVYGDGATVKTALFNGGDMPVIVNKKVFASGKKAIKLSKKETKQSLFTPPVIEEFHESTLEYWFDDYFIEYGEVVGMAKDSQKKNKVFYLNKIDLNN